MIRFIAVTRFMSKWDRFRLWLRSPYWIEEHGNGDVLVYTKGSGGVVASAHSSLEDACAWCEKQIKDNKVKSVTYVLEDE